MQIILYARWSLINLKVWLDKITDLKYIVPNIEDRNEIRKMDIYDRLPTIL